MGMKEEWLGQFQNPDSFHRSFPFWGWNGKLEKEELIAQVRLMKEVGVGGFFIHSRDGLETEYLGEEWMACVKAVVEEAKALDMCVWLYDEDRFPAGTAGGRVPAGGDAYRCKGLTLEVMEPAAYTELYRKEILLRVRESGFGEYSFADDKIGFIAAYAAIVDGDTIHSARRLPLQKQQSFAPDEVLLVVRLQVSAPSEWFNHETPPDNLNPDCTRRFIAETHEKYKQVVGEEFGKTIRGIFTDEPSVHDRHCFFGEKRAWIPWTYGYGAYFEDLTGYDFLEVLPWFYFNGEQSRRVRQDYWYTISKRFGESYFKVIGEWCEENNLFFTGHFLQEDKMGLATRVNGAVMPNYQYQHIPGIDMLGEQTKEYLTVKQCTSVARQLGKKYVLSETYGCTGWEFTLEGQKWMGDWQYVLGVNRRCQHMALYSLRGCRKRDYPPSFNYNTNWWEYNRYMEDYFARFAVVAEQGQAVADVLLLHPGSTVWSRLGCSPYGNSVRKNERDIPALNAYGEQYNQLLAQLLHQHFDVDLGDEMLISQYGAVRNGCFAIGEMDYRAVVLPPGMDTLLDSTRKLLEAFVEQGGHVYVLEPAGPAVSGEKFVVLDSVQRLLQQLEPYRRIHIKNGMGQECSDVLYQLRKTDTGYFLILVNHNRAEDVQVTVTLPFPAKPAEWDLMTGEVRDVERFMNSSVTSDAKAFEHADVALQMQVFLEKSGSAVYCLEPLSVKSTVLTEAEQYRLDRPNVLPLDMCRYRIDGGEWSAEMEIWQAQKQIREVLGMRQIYHNGLEQRYKWVGIPHPGDGHRVKLLYAFEVATADEQVLRNISLAVELLEHFDIRCNDKDIAVQKNGWLLDKAFETTRLSNLCIGRNELILSCGYSNDMELENIYLAGNFGVTKQRRITALPECLSLGDWTGQGLLHYCGSVTWQYTYEKEEDAGEVLLVLPQCRAICMEIRVNDNVQVLPWNFARELSIGKWLQKGSNSISVKVVGSPRNMMGPFHLKEKPSRTNDAVFCPKPEQYNPGYYIEPYGIMGELKIIELQ